MYFYKTNCNGYNNLKTNKQNKRNKNCVGLKVKIILRTIDYIII